MDHHNAVSTIYWSRPQCDSRGERMDVMHIVWKPAQCDDTDVWAYVHGQQGTMSGCAAKKSILMSII